MITDLRARNEQAVGKMSEAAIWLTQNLNVPDATGMPEATKLDTFQYQHLNNLSTLAITQKSRQVGWSWTCAAEAVAYGCMTPYTDSIFVSINEEEAGEKIRYAKMIIEALLPDMKPRLTVDNNMRLEFSNGSRLISHPCRPVRGKARARVYLDEFAHYMKDRQIYQSAVPVITKGGVIRIGSSSYGASGMFWEIVTQTMRPFPGYFRHYVPWWSVRALCIDPLAATLAAPSMMTEERVDIFATPRMKEIFENMVLEDFQQEYECAWVDESISWIDWDIIHANTALDQDKKLLHYKAKNVDEAMTSIDLLAQAIYEGRVTQPTLVGGMDVGRKHDTTDIVLLSKGDTSEIPYRMGITLDRVPFDKQRAVIDAIMDKLPVVAFAIDQNGLGMQLAEDSQHRWGVRIYQAEFTNATKALWAAEVKLRFQRHESPIPADRDLMYQIHSIKRKVTESKNVVYDVDKNEQHHADKFWALALATFMAKNLSSAGRWIAAMEKRKKAAEDKAALQLAKAEGLPLPEPPPEAPKPDWVKPEEPPAPPVQHVDRKKILGRQGHFKGRR